MENAQFYTYLHCRPDGSPFYVGKGTGDRSRRFSVRGAHHKSIVAKHGRKNIGVYVFPCESEEQAHADEVQQIAQLRREGYELCNHTDGGEGASGYSHSDATKAKMSAINKGRAKSPRSKEHCEKLSIARKGKTVSVETRAKLSALMMGHRMNIGRVMSQETKRKLSAANLGKKQSIETRAKRSAALTGQVRTPEARAHIRAAQVGKIVSKETKAKLSAARRAYLERNK